MPEPRAGILVPEATVMEAMKCLFAASMLAKEYDKPNTAETFHQAYDALGEAMRWQQGEELSLVGWTLHIEADGGNDAFWWAEQYPESPADGAVPVYGRKP